MDDTRGGRLQGLRILVVEDDPASARMLAALCTSEGAEVRIAHTPTEAMATLMDFPARVAIVDLILPRMSGLALVRTIKGSPSTSAIVVVAVSILNGPNIERLSLEAGCVAFVRKPSDIDHLVETVFEHLE
jgi:CheY-like chemotaxis protein